MADIQYNSLNLPSQPMFEDSRSVKSVYDVNDVKGPVAEIYFYRLSNYK